MAAPKAWMEFCYVTITRAGGSNVEFGARTQDITLPMGSKPVEVLNVNTGQIPKFNRPDVMEVSLDNTLPVNLDHGIAQFDNTSGVTDLTGTSRRPQNRVVLLWTDQSGITSATQAISTGSYALRAVYKDLYFSELGGSWSDQILQANKKFRCPYMDETGGYNLRWQSATGSNSLSALSAYTGGNFG